MDNLIEIAVALVCGGAGVFIFRLLNPKTNTKENQQVIVKVEDITKKNDEILKKAEEIINSATKKTDELEKEKNKEQSTEQLEDFFNTRNK